MELEDDPIFQLLMSGEATTLDEAEDILLDRSMPEILALLASDASSEQLEKHPLMELLRRKGTRGWEDSLL